MSLFKCTYGETKWHTILDKIVNNYNSNYHSTIKTSPKEIIKMDPGSNEIDEIKSRIKKRAIKHGDIDSTNAETSPKSNLPSFDQVGNKSKTTSCRHEIRTARPRTAD